MDIGINDASIKYEVALGVLGHDLMSLKEAIRLENEKSKPSIAAISFLKNRMMATVELQQALTLTMTMRYAHLAPDHLEAAIQLNPLAFKS